MPLRHQDPTTGRWNGIDPVTHFSSSTYGGYNNNPVFWADPSGAWGDPVNGLTSSQGSPASGGGGGGIFGTLLNIGVNLAVKGLQSLIKNEGADVNVFLNKKGETLSAGNGKGSKIYIVEKYTTDINNNFVYAEVNDVNVQLLTLNGGATISESLFAQIVRTVYTEMGSTATTSVNEGAAIYSVIENRARYNNTTELVEMMRPRQVNGWLKRNRSLLLSKKGRMALEGVIKAMISDTDFSGGAYFWQGKDLGYNGTIRWKNKGVWGKTKSLAYNQYFQTGLKFTLPHHNLWNLGTHQNGVTVYKYQTTGTAGYTTFLRLSTVFKIINKTGEL